MKAPDLSRLVRAPVLLLVPVARLPAADLDAWMKQQGDTQTVFGKPLLLNEPVTLITPGGAKKK